MSRMAPNKRIAIVVSPELREALSEHCAKHKIELSAYIRELICRDMGKPELLDTIPPEGRPKPQRAGDEQD